MFTPPVTRLVLPALLGLLAVAGCKKEEPAAPLAVQMRPGFAHLVTPAKSDPAAIPLMGTDGSSVTFGQIATGKVVVVIPWVPPQQQEALERIRELNKALEGVSGAQVIALNVQRAPKEAYLAEMAKLSRDEAIPVYVDAEVQFLPFINEHLRVRARNRKVMTIPPYVLFAGSLRQVVIDIPSEHLGQDARNLVEEALRAPPPPADAPQAEEAKPSEEGAPPAPTDTVVPASPAPGDTDAAVSPTP